jgi:hypothetical protein
MTPPVPKPKRSFEENLALANARGKPGPVVLPGDLMVTAAQPATVAQLPLWPEPVRGVPNAVLRSALFGAIKRGKRAFQQGVKKASVEGVTVIHTGPQLDQADLDVWEQCLHLARTSGLGMRIQFSAGGFLKAIERGSGGKDIEWLKNAFRRLSSSVVEVADGKRAYFGPMLIGGARDDETGHYVIEVNPKIVSLFGADGWSSIEFAARRALKRQPLSQWLHGFYSSHARPFPMKVETLHRLCGSENKQLAGFRRELAEALERLAEVTGWTHEIDDADLVHVAKTGTASQQRHLSAAHGKRLMKKLSTK